MSLRSSLKGEQFGDHCDMLAGVRGMSVAWTGAAMQVERG